MTFKYIYTFVFLAFVSNLFAQVPGFMGKRLLITANVGPSFAIPFSTYGADTDYKFRPKLGITTEYTISRKISLGFKYTYSKTNLTMSVYEKSPFYFGEFDELYTTPAVVNNHTLSFRWTKHRSGNLPAPLGFYSGHDFGIGFGSFVDTKGLIPNENGKFKKGTYLTAVLPNLSTFIGSRRAIGKHLMLGFNMELNWIATGYVLFNFDYDPFNNNTGSVDLSDKTAGEFQYMVSRNAARLSYYYSNLLNLSLDITFLP
jgi:hypothetical protein